MQKEGEEAYADMIARCALTDAAARRAHLTPSQRLVLWNLGDPGLVLVLLPGQSRWQYAWSGLDPLNPAEGRWKPTGSPARVAYVRSEVERMADQLAEMAPAVSA